MISVDNMIMNPKYTYATIVTKSCIWPYAVLAGHPYTGMKITVNHQAISSQLSTVATHFLV